MSTVLEITNAIERLDVKAQVALLRELPRHLKISPEDLAWARVAEGSFDFWDNPEDAIYDQLEAERTLPCPPVERYRPPRQ